MTETALLHNYQLIAALLFGIGLVGFLLRRNMIVMFLCAELMLQGVSLSLVAFSRFHNDWGGQSLVVFIIAVAACEAAIAMALILMLVHRHGLLDIATLQSLHEAGQPPHVDRQVPEEIAPVQRWPSLTPAGHEQPEDETKRRHRSHV